MFLVTQPSGGKMFSFLLENTDSLKPVLINKSVWRGWIFRLASRSGKLRFWLRAGRRGRSSSRSGCACACSGHGAACPAQSSWSGARTDTGCGVPDAEGTPICGGQWVTAWKFGEISRRGRLWPFILSECCDFVLCSFLWNSPSNDLPLWDEGFFFF